MVVRCVLAFYQKIPKYSDTCKIDVIILKFVREISPKDADGMANSVDPDQTVPLGAETAPVETKDFLL